MSLQRAPGGAPTYRRRAGAEDYRVRRVELIISRVLRAGVVTSLVVIVVGMAMAFAGHASLLHSATVERKLTSGNARFARSPSTMLAELRAGEGRGVVSLGLVILLLTPVVRVGVSIVTFLYQHDRAFVGVTCFVLAILVASFVLGARSG